MLRLTQYGLREVAVCTVVLGAMTAVGGLLYWPAAIPPALLLGWALWFFRDPPRRPADSGGLLAPADGTVVDITPVGPDSPLGRTGTRIGIFMSIFSAHVNRSPADAVVESVEHKCGGFVDARRPDAADVNECAWIRLRLAHGRAEFPLIVRQVAGLIARRIVTRLVPGQRLSAGQRFGMIKFGSRAELWVPQELIGRLAVRRGDRVRAGHHVLVYLSEERP